MSPQFVDFDADGHLDIVAGIFDGSPHLARGSAKGWAQPEQILDAKGERILLNQFWHFEHKKWEDTQRCDAPGAVRGHLTSAVAMDWDGDGAPDLLLGDHLTGRIYRRMNHGKPGQPAFDGQNLPVLVGGAPLTVPSTVATLRLVDWDRDGRPDLIVSTMGNAYEGGGGGVWLFRNTGSKTAPVFAPGVALLEAKPNGEEATGPDAGFYADVADVDGDGDLDLVVGGYSHWLPKSGQLTAAQERKVADLRELLAVVERRSTALVEQMDAAAKGSEGEAAERKRTEFLTAHRAEFAALGKQRQALQEQLDPLVPGRKREAYVWYYENRTPR